MVVAFRVMTLGERVKTAREHAKLKRQEDLALRIEEIYGKGSGPAQQTIGRLESGGAKTTEFIVKIATACGVSPWWLDSETGPMLLDHNASIIVNVPRVDPDLLEGCIELYLERTKKFNRKLPPKLKAEAVAELYSTIKPDGSPDMERVLTLITSRQAAYAKGVKHGNEGKHKRDSKKNSRRGTTGDRA